MADTSIYLIRGDVDLGSKRWTPRDLPNRTEVGSVVAGCFHSTIVKGRYLVTAEPSADGLGFQAIFMRHLSEDQDAAVNHYPDLPLEDALVSQFIYEMGECLRQLPSPHAFLSNVEGPFPVSEEEAERIWRDRRWTA